jgi:hypothetical protein
MLAKYILLALRFVRVNSNLALNSIKCNSKKVRAILLFFYLCFCGRVFSGFSTSVNGISSSFDIMPKPENIALRLLTSVWLIVPISGATVKYVAKKSA